MSRSLSRALSIMELFTYNKKEWGISEISRELQLPKSTVYNLVKTLEKETFLAQNRDGKYRLGIRLFELGRVYSEGNELIAVSEPIVEFLMKKYKQNIHIAIYAGRRAVFVVNKKAGTDTGHSIFTRTGYDIPAYCTAVGKVLLAWQSPEHIAYYLNTELLVSFTTWTITSKDALKEEVNNVRQQGYAVDRQEAITGLGCIAAPIFGHSGQIIAAMSVSGEADKVLCNDTFEECCRDVMDTARKISQAMGFWDR